MKDLFKRFSGVFAIIGSVIAGAAAVVLIITCVVSASEKASILSQYNAEKQDHDEAVEKAENKIEKLEDQTAELNAQNDKSKDSILSANNEYGDLDGSIRELENKIAELESQKKELEDTAAQFLGSEEFNAAKSAEDALSEIIINQQNAIYSMKKEAANYIQEVYFDLNITVGGGKRLEDLYTLEPPMDIPKEFLKTVIGKVAEEYDDDIMNIAAGVASDMVDGSDLFSAVGSQLQSAIQSKIEGSRDELIDAATAGLYSKFNDVINVADNFKSLYNKLTNTTPEYCAKYILGDMEQYIAKLGDFIDDTNVTADDAARLTEAFSKLSQLAQSYSDVTGSIYGFSFLVENYVDQARDLYNLITVDNERMAYYFAIMEDQ